jgi:hypothetical protein
MKMLLTACLLIANVSYAGDLGVFSDGGKSSFRIYQNETQVIIRSAAKTTVFSRASGEDPLYYPVNPEDTGYIEILDADNALLNLNACAQYLTKKNMCK